MEIRRAEEGELAELVRIQLRALNLDEILETLLPGEVPALYRHGYAHGETFVALERDVPVGFSVGYHRDGTWFLGEFFVLPDAQQAGIGQALLHHAKPDHRHCATVSTSDYRAQALYARSGMTPLWPSFQLRAGVDDLSLLATSEYAIAETELSPAVRAWDASVSGRRRPEDLEFLLNGWNGSFLWIEQAGQRVGYAGYARRGNGRVTIGPVGVREPGHAQAAVLAVVDWVASSDGISALTIDLHGLHPALPALLAGGFRIADQNIFCASDATGFGDPCRYVPLTPAIY